MTGKSEIPDDYALHIVEQQMPVEDLIRQLYEYPSPQTHEHFRRVNSHLADGIARPGQIVLISPENTLACTLQEEAFRDLSERVDRLLLSKSPDERRLLARHYQFLSDVASYNGAILGTSVSVWQSHVKQVEGILKDIEKSYVGSYNRHGNLSNTGFFNQRRLHFRRLDDTLRRFLQPRLGGSLMPGDMRRNLGLSSKSIVHQWKAMGGPATSIPGFADNYAQTARMASHLKKLGYVGIGLTALEAGANIQQACTVEPDGGQCSRSKYTESGKAVGSVIGSGLVGGGAGWLTCSVIFGLPSAGSSMFWCGVLVGGTGGYFGGKAGDSLGEFTGNTIYETRLAP